VLPLVAGRVTFGLLTATVVAQHPEGGSIEGYGAAARGGLRQADVHGATEGDALPQHAESRWPTAGFVENAVDRGVSGVCAKGAGQGGFGAGGQAFAAMAARPCRAGR